MIVGTVVGVAQTERQADARVLEHRARRLPAASRWSRRNDIGKGAMLFYLLAYAVTNLGAFGVIALLDERRSAERSGARLRRAVERRIRRSPR